MTTLMKSLWIVSLSAVYCAFRSWISNKNWKSDLSEEHADSLIFCGDKGFSSYDFEWNWLYRDLALSF